MESIFSQRGQLDLVVTRGWLSAWELAGLEAGRVVVGDTLNAGQDGELTLDGRFLGRASLLVLGNDSGPYVSAVRLEGLERETPLDPEPDRGGALLELLPFEIVFEGCAYSLAELREAGAGSVVSLDRPYLAGVTLADAPRLSLRVAGRVAARGPAVVVGERFGLLVDECPSPRTWDGERRASGAVLRSAKEPTRPVKFYDWRRPDCFTRRQIRAIQDIHGRAMDTFNQLVPAAGGLEVVEVDQMTYREFLDSLSGEVRLLSCGLGGREREYRREPPAAGAGIALIQPVQAALPLDSQTARRVAEYARVSAALAERRLLLMTMAGAASPLADYGPDLAAALRSGWKTVCDMNFTKPQLEAAPPLLRLEGGQLVGSAAGILEHGMVLLVGCTCPGGRLNLVYAAQSLYPAWKALERHGR